MAASIPSSTGRDRKAPRQGSVQALVGGIEADVHRLNARFSQRAGLPPEPRAVGRQGESLETERREPGDQRDEPGPEGRLSPGDAQDPYAHGAEQRAEEYQMVVGQTPVDGRRTAVPAAIVAGLSHRKPEIGMDPTEGIPEAGITVGHSARSFLHP
jgi:hypothetical protein